MDLETEAWEVEEKSDGYIRLTREGDRIFINRNDDELAGERWFFDFEPSDGEPISEQFRVEKKTELHAEIGILIENHT